MAGSIAAAPILKASIGSTPLVRISLGTALLWDGVPFTPAGAKLNASHVTTTSFAQVKGYAADAAYPGSTVAADRLVIPTAGAGVTLAAAIVFSSGTSYGFDMTLQLWLDGTLVQTGAKFSCAAFGSATATVSLAGQTVNAGSQLMVHAKGGSQFNSAPTLAANAASYMRAYIP